jgi:hypothetical protein
VDAKLPPANQGDHVLLAAALLAAAPIKGRCESSHCMDCILCACHHPVTEYCRAFAEMWCDLNAHKVNLTSQDAYERRLLDLFWER